MGHGSMQMTYDVYGHLLKDDEDLVDRLSAAASM